MQIQFLAASGDSEAQRTFASGTQPIASHDQPTMQNMIKKQ